MLFLKVYDLWDMCTVALVFILIGNAIGVYRTSRRYDEKINKLYDERRVGK